MGIAGLSGKIVGAATYCGASQERLRLFGEHMVAAAWSVARNSEEKTRAIDFMATAGTAQINKMKSGGDPISCTEVAKQLAKAEAEIGFR
ncbi:hypothetical protein ACI2KH_06190 [Roseomonas mucosa]|uniref:hypothetical protein n=1 Tax=Roseomonas mucosa TaxID=207340 RepID=UPI00384AB3B1